MTTSDSFLGRMSSSPATQLPASLIRKPMNDRHPDQQLIVRAAGKVVGLPVAVIEWIEADRNYVLLHSGGATHKVRDTLQRIRTVPALAGFVQIHRSVLVNKTHVAEVSAHNTHDWEARLMNGTGLKVGRRYLEHVRTHLAAKLRLPALERKGA